MYYKLGNSTQSHTTLILVIFENLKNIKTDLFTFEKKCLIFCLILSYMQILNLHKQKARVKTLTMILILNEIIIIYFDLTRGRLEGPTIEGGSEIEKTGGAD